MLGVVEGAHVQELGERPVPRVEDETFLGQQLGTPVRQIARSPDTALLGRPPADRVGDVLVAEVDGRGVGDVRVPLLGDEDAHGFQARQPRGRLRPQDPGADQAGDLLGVPATTGEPQHRQLGAFAVLAGGFRLLAFPVSLVLSVVSGRVGGQDVLRSAPAAAGRPQRQALHDAGIEGAQRPQDGHQGLERGRGGHVPALVLLRQQDGDEQACRLSLVRLLPQRAADRLHDVHGAAADIREQHAVQAAAARDVGAFTQEAAGGQDAELRLTALRINPAGDLIEHGTPVRGRMEATQPLPPHLPGEAAGRAQLGSSIRETTGEGERLLSAGVERQQAHHPGGLHVGESGRADGAQPGPASLLQRGTVSEGRGIADLQDVDLESGQHPLLDGLPERVGEGGFPEDGLVVHGGDQRLALLATCRGGFPDAGRGRQVQAAVGRDTGVVVDDGPRLRRQSGGTVRLVHHRQAEPVQLLPERPGQRPLQHPGDRPFLGRLLVLLVLLRVAGGATAGVAHQGGIGGEDGGGTAAGPQRQPERIGGAANVQFVSQVGARFRVAVEGADRHRRAGHAVLAPLGHRLRQQIEGGHQHQHSPPRLQTARHLIRDQRLARTGGGDHLSTQPLVGDTAGRGLQREDRRVNGFPLPAPQLQPPVHTVLSRLRASHPLTQWRSVCRFSVPVHAPMLSAAAHPASRAVSRRRAHHPSQLPWRLVGSRVRAEVLPAGGRRWCSAEPLIYDMAPPGTAPDKTGPSRNI